jgi:hypothetical protein
LCSSGAGGDRLEGISWACCKKWCKEQSLADQSMIRYRPSLCEDDPGAVNCQLPLTSSASHVHQLLSICKPTLKVCLKPGSLGKRLTSSCHSGDDCVGCLMCIPLVIGQPEGFSQGGGGGGGVMVVGLRNACGWWGSRISCVNGFFL